MAFGDMARWAIEQDHARHVTVDEVIRILDACGEAGMVHTGLPGVILCNCCKHACVNLYAMKMGKTHTYSKNHFHAVDATEMCTSCGTCVERCPVGAIQIETTAVMDQDRCIGCGACAAGCEEESIKMVRRSEEEIVRLDAEFMEAFGNVISKTRPDPLMMKLFEA
jgi:ferredoxin